MDEKIALVKKGYAKAAQPYREQKDAEQSKITLLQQFLDSTMNILELGCASGFPIGQSCLSAGKQYTGIDLAPEQIKIAREQFPQWQSHFHEAEMLQFCREQTNAAFHGVISMFSIRHLPRIYHAELYTQIYRILRKDGLLLIDCTLHPHDGSSDDWLGGSTMYWSGFSKEWTLQTLTDLKFTLVNTYVYTKEFNGKPESTLFLLLRK